MPPPGRRRIVEDRNQRATAEWRVHSDNRASFDGDIDRAIAEDAPDAGVAHRQAANRDRVRRRDAERGVHRTGWCDDPRPTIACDRLHGCPLLRADALLLASASGP